MSKRKYYRWYEVVTNLKACARPQPVNERLAATRVALGLCPIHAERLHATFDFPSPGFDTLRCVRTCCTFSIWAGLKSSAYRHAKH